MSPWHSVGVAIEKTKLNVAIFWVAPLRSRKFTYLQENCEIIFCLSGTFPRSSSEGGGWYGYTKATPEEVSPNEKGIRVVSGSEDNTVNVVNDDLESEKQNSLLLIYELLFLRFF